MKVRFPVTEEERFAERNVEEEHLELYTDDPAIASKDAPFPGWLKATYIILPIWGILTWYYFFNGTHGWLDPGSWNELQKAALTTFPTETLENLDEQDAKR
jgi:hypothetical protein